MPVMRNTSSSAKRSSSVPKESSAASPQRVYQSAPISRESIVFARRVTKSIENAVKRTVQDFVELTS